VGVFAAGARKRRIPSEKQNSLTVSLTCLFVTTLPAGAVFTASSHTVRCCSGSRGTRGRIWFSEVGWISQGEHKRPRGLGLHSCIKLAATWDPLISLFAHLSFRKAPPPDRIFAYKIFGDSEDRGAVPGRDLPWGQNGIGENMEVGSGPGINYRGR
jgi:hypothetical protein